MCVQIQSRWWLPLGNSLCFSAKKGLVVPGGSNRVSGIAAAVIFVNPYACFSLPPALSVERAVKDFKGFCSISSMFQGTQIQVLAIATPYTLPLLSALGRYIFLLKGL